MEFTPEAAAAQDLYAAVTGKYYQQAQEELLTQQLLLERRRGKGFEKAEACEEFAKALHVDREVYMQSRLAFYKLSHKGEIMGHEAWISYYKDLLFYMADSGKTDEAGEPIMKPQIWLPDGFSAKDKAYTASEYSDGIHEALYYRDYARPRGYFNRALGRFNVAYPFKTGAKETGYDTSAIYLLLKHLAGECYPYLLAWLRSKMLRPYQKTEVVPIFTGAEGTGKSTFGEVICKALFEPDNVIVTERYSASNRFNSDQADKLVICIEEKTEDDNKVTNESLKSSATATQVRKENKGIDPIYQDSYTELLVTTNEYVPLRFENDSDHRRFMIMEVDPNFSVRKGNKEAIACFTALYGSDAISRYQTGVPGLVHNKEMLQQFKWELLTGIDGCGEVSPRGFPKTAAYKRCYLVPKSSEEQEIEELARLLVQVMAALLSLPDDYYKAEKEKEGPNSPRRTILAPRRLVLEEGDEPVSLGDITAFPNGIFTRTKGASWGCYNKTFFRNPDGKPYKSPLVDRVLSRLQDWMQRRYGVVIKRDHAWGALPPGLPISFKNTYYTEFARDPLWVPLTPEEIAEEEEAQAAQAATDKESFSISAEDPTQVALLKAELQALLGLASKDTKQEAERLQATQASFLRYTAEGGAWKLEPHGEFETLNPIKPGMARSTANAASYARFLLEADEAPPDIVELEQEWLKRQDPKKPVDAEQLYQRRLELQQERLLTLYKEGILSRAVYSGAKSIHMIIEVADAPTTLEERNWLDAYLKERLGTSSVTFDASTADPARLTRAPVEFERRTRVGKYTVVGTQNLLTEPKCLYNLSWRAMYAAWKNSPPDAYEQRGRKLMPSKPEFRAAAKALLDGSFWRDAEWNGQRQHLFFPAYRLVRMLGYSSEELWTSFGEDLAGYYKPQEIPAWLMKRKSGLIQSIDQEVDALQEEADARN